jgi:putative spermidine/putrescine transport system ATP-binding protein
MCTGTTDKQDLHLAGMSHRYGARRVVDGVDVSATGGELVSLLGPSGCGKTTLLKIVAGFVRREIGRVLVGGAAIDHVPANRRRVGMIGHTAIAVPDVLRSIIAAGPTVLIALTIVLAVVMERIAGLSGRLG